MDFRQKERLKKIIEHYGEEAQVKKAAEEFAELIRALMRGDRDNIAEEMADCRIMLGQLEIIYKNDVRVHYWECMKTARTLAGVMREEAEMGGGRPLSSAQALTPSPKGEGMGGQEDGKERPGTSSVSGEAAATFPRGEGRGDGKNDQAKD